MHAADFFRYSPHESEDSAVASDEEEEEDDDSELELEAGGGAGGGAGSGNAVGEDGGGGGGGGRSRRQYTEMKEQMYQDKLQHLKRQLDQLNDESLPEYTKKLRRLEATYRERMRICAVIRDLEVDMVEQDYLNEKRSAVREFEEQKVYMRDQLINELEEKQRLIEAERHTLELTGDNMDIKPISKRQLRRRVHDGGGGAGGASSGYGEKRRGNGNGNGKPINMVSLNFLLEDNDIHDDLKIINKNKAFSTNKASQGQGGPEGGACGNASSASTSSSGGGGYHRDTRIEEGKLFYEKRWFRRGQSVQVETKNDKFPAMITAIGTEDILVRKSTDNSKLRIYVTWLTKGKYVLKRRAA